MAGIPFLKMNGLGNDFVVIDARETKPDLSQSLIAQLGARGADGIGFDQFISVERSPVGATAFMRIWNSDGGEVAACGNATRCVGQLLMEESGSDWATIQTRAGLLNAYATEDPDFITVNMGAPRLAWDQIPLAEEFRDTKAIELQIGPIDDPILDTPSVVNVGNPHAIFWVEDPESYDLAKVGPLLERHPMFPEGANISLARVNTEDSITIKVWERGAGLTKACGTAACAVTVAAVRKKYTDRKVTVELPAGDLIIEWRSEDDNIWMTGPVETEFEGEFDPVSGSWTRVAAPEPVFDEV